MRAILLLVGAAVLAGCATASAPPATSVACSSFEPIRWSRQDTEETVRQAKQHNAAGVALCGWGKP